MKWIKILFSIVGLLILVCVFVIGSLIIFLDPNKLKSVLIEETMKQTGYQLTIKGSLSWAFYYPNIAIKAEEMILSAPGQSTPFIEVKGVKIATELNQFLRGNEKLQGKLFISHLQLMSVKAENVSTDLSWKDNVLTLESVSALLYGGSMTGKAIGRDLSGTPDWRWDMQFSHIQLQPLLQDLNGPNSKIKLSGVGQIKLQAEAKGKTQNEMLDSINGNGEFSLNDGIVQGIDLNYLVQTADALVNKQSITPPVNINQTAFTSLTGTFNIKNGIAETHNLLLTSSAFTTQGDGSLALASQALNLHLRVKPQQNAKFQWDIPVLVAGNINHPDVRLDMTDVEKLIAKQELETLKTKAVEQIKEHLHGKAAEFLQNLLGS